GAAAAAPLAAAAGAAGAALLEVEQIVELVRDLRRVRVVDRLDVDLLAGPADVDLLDDPEHALDVRPRLRDDEQVALRVDGDVALLGLELAQHRGGVVRVD